MKSLPGLGLDLISISRFASVLERGGADFKDKVYTPQEQESAEARKNPCQHYAARFAGKEAVLKALGRGLGQGMSLQEIEILSDGRSAPRIVLHGKALAVATKLGVVAWSISLSHSRDTAGAVVNAHF